KTGESIEVREKPDGLFPVQILQREREVRSHLAQHAQLVFTYRARLGRTDGECTYRRLIDQQGNRDQTTDSLGEQLPTELQAAAGTEQVVADGLRPGAKRPAGDRVIVHIID